MCLTYRPKRRPAFTRLCYRYRDLRGQHTCPASGPAENIPNPAAGRLETGPGRPDRTPQDRTRSASGAGRPARRPPHCEDCSIAVQILALPEEMRRTWAGKLGIDPGTGLNPGPDPETPGPADRDETEIQPRLFADPPD